MIVINVDNLGLPGDSRIGDALSMIPDLLDRSEYINFANYDIQVDDKSVGSSRDVVLEHTKLREVRKIEITLKSDVTQQNDGFSGTINIIQRDLSEGVGGDVSLTLSTEPDAMTGVTVNYKKKALEVRTNFQLEYYGPTIREHSETSADNFWMEAHDTTRETYLMQTGKVFLQYMVGDRDKIRTWLWETCEKDRRDRSLANDYYIIEQGQAQGEGYVHHIPLAHTSNTTDNIVSLTAMADYTHFLTDDRGKFVVEGSYYFTPKKSYQNGDFTGTTRPSNFKSTVKYEGQIIPALGNTLKLKAGVNFNGAFTPMPTGLAETFHTSPYLELQYSEGPLKIYGGIRYQRDSKAVPREGQDTFRQISNDVTGKINVVWQIAGNHSLRFIAGREALTPSESMLFTESKLGKPNPDLKNAHITSVGLDYIYEWKKKEHSVIGTIGIGYDRGDGLFEKKYLENRTGGLTETYVNSGLSNTFTSKLLLTYKNSILSLSFLGNAYLRECLWMESQKYNLHYNLSVIPIVQLPDDWRISSSIVYNSRIYQENLTIGDCLLGSVCVEKKFGEHWTVFCRLYDVFDIENPQIETDSASNLVQHLYKDTYIRSISAGFTFRF